MLPSCLWVQFSFQGWRLDPILQLGLALFVLGVIVESIPSICTDERAFARRLHDRAWPWPLAHAVLLFNGLYYAIMRRTIALFWDAVDRV